VKDGAILRVGGPFGQGPHIRLSLRLNCFVEQKGRCLREQNYTGFGFSWMRDANVTQMLGSVCYRLVEWTTIKASGSPARLQVFGLCDLRRVKVPYPTWGIIAAPSSTIKRV